MHKEQKPRFHLEKFKRAIWLLERMICFAAMKPVQSEVEPEST